MADSFQDKTEEATPKRKQESREKGQVSKSPEFNSVVLLLAAFLSLSFLGAEILDKLSYGFRVYYQGVSDYTISANSLQYYVTLGVKSLAMLLLPLVGVIMITGVATNVAQFGFLLTWKPLTPDFSKLNPVSGLKRLFSTRAFVDLAKNIFELCIIGTIAYYAIVSLEDKFFLLINAEVENIVQVIGSTVYVVAVKILGFLLVLTILDFAYQKWQHKKDMRMTKQDVKDEQVQSEGNPQIKSAIRSMQLKMVRQRMMEKIPEADVVITNPTHLAVALKYDPSAMAAPIVLAKGERLIAEKIKEIATQHHIPILENKPLARSLFKVCEIGAQVPAALFQAVAEVFAHVYQLRHRRN